MSEKEQGEAPKRPRHNRSARHVKAAASILRKEARRILRKYVSRIAPQPAEQIRASLAEVERCQEKKDLEGLAVATEELDELLHQHASFARTGALRETGENIAVAVLVALALRSCVYEPFKIPSGSMMPTLRAGDHIFVNKFVYGIQIPLTNTVVGESLGEIKRGDVIVFRYPIDEREDFIKRVIGLPGDTIRVDGIKVSIKRAGEAEFETLKHEKLSEPCHDES
ncbi:MAG: signal peptidase I, partial [Nannocystaceae bacterium]